MSEKIENNEELDKVYRDKAEGFEVKPRPEAFDAIAGKVEQQEDVKSIAPKHKAMQIWKVAAAFLLLATLSYVAYVKLNPGTTTKNNGSSKTPKVPTDTTQRNVPNINEGTRGEGVAPGE